MSDTPRTDEAIEHIEIGAHDGFSQTDGPWVSVAFARKLERELAAAANNFKRALAMCEELVNIVLDEYKGRVLPLKRTSALIEKMRKCIADMEEVK